LRPVFRGLILVKSTASAARRCDGFDIADAAARVGSKTVVISGYLSELAAGATERHQLFAKPLSPAVIVAAVKGAIGNPRGSH